MTLNLRDITTKNPEFTWYEQHWFYTGKKHKQTLVAILPCLSRSAWPRTAWQILPYCIHALHPTLSFTFCLAPYSLTNIAILHTCITSYPVFHVLLGPVQHDKYCHIAYMHYIPPCLSRSAWPRTAWQIFPYCIHALHPTLIPPTWGHFKLCICLLYWLIPKPCVGETGSICWRLISYIKHCQGRNYPYQ